MWFATGGALGGRVDACRVVWKSLLEIETGLMVVAGAALRRQRWVEGKAASS